MAAGISATAAQLQAIEPEDVLLFHRGPVSLRPQLTVSESFNDNIFFRNHRRRSDLISVLSPGVNLALGREDANHIAFDYQYDHFFYADNSQLDTDQHLLDFVDHLEWSRVHLEGRDSVHFLSGIIGGGERSSIGDRNVKSTTHFDDYTLTYDLTGKTSMYVRGRYDATDYEKGTPLFSINNLTGTLGFGFQAFPRLGFLGEGYYGQTAVSPNVAALPGSPHSDFFGGFVGAKGKFTEKLTGAVKLGYEVREFSDNTPAPTAPVIEASLTEAFTERTSISLGYTRRTMVSVQFAKESFTSESLNADFKQVIGPAGKLVADVGGSYSLNDFKKTDFLAKRTDSDYRVGATLTYHIQLWLRAILSYDFEKFSSDLPGVIDYHVNRVNLRLAAGY